MTQTTNRPKSVILEDWDPQYLKYRISCSEFKSISAIARAWNAEHKLNPVSVDTLQHSIHKKIGPIYEIIIAWALNVSEKEIWPTRFDTNGDRILYDRNQNPRLKIVK